MSEVIEFYSRSETPYGKFSNLTMCAICIDDVWYDSVEHAYQSKKCASPLVRDWLLQAPCPDLVATTAHALLPWHINKKWSQIKYRWMYLCVFAKFSTYTNLKDLLLGTKDTELVEAGKTDNEVNRTWGRVNGKGRNLLGRILMKVRSQLGGVSYEDAELEELIKRGQDD